jgi:hypothetical protein
MKFQKYEREINDFLNGNYQNLKRVKVANSEFALKELLQTEQADINNYARSLVSKITMDARKSFVAIYDAEKGYELGETYKASVKAPVFKQIEVNFAREAPMNKRVHSNAIQQQTAKRSAAQNFETKSPANQYRARNLAIGAGVTTAVVAFPATMFLSSASFGTSLLVAGLSAVVVAGIVYIVVSYMDANGQQQTGYVAPAQNQIQKERPSTTTKQTIDHSSMSQLLDLRKAEAQRVLLKTIEDAQQKYEQMQVQTV